MAEYLPQKLGQNYVDYIMKQYQTWVDALLGEDNDNSAVPVEDVATFSGLTGAQIYTAWAEGVSVGFYADVVTTVNIGKNNNGNVISDYTVLSEFTGNYAGLNAPLRAYFNSTNYYCEMWGSYKRSDNTPNNTWYFQSTELDSSEINANYVLNDTRSGQSYSERPWIPQSDLLLNDSGQLTGTRSLLGVTNYTPYAGNLGNPVMNVPSFTNVTDVVNVDTSSPDYHTTTYTTNEGDNITIRYNEYSVNLGSAGYELSYDDLFDIFANIIIPSLPDGQNTIVVPTYDEIKYSDQGNFYITPLHQYNKLPTAPQIEQEIDFGEYPAVLAETSTAFFNMLPATFSALLAGTLVLAVLIRNIGR